MQLAGISAADIDKKTDVPGELACWQLKYNHRHAANSPPSYYMLYVIFLINGRDYFDGN